MTNFCLIFMMKDMLNPLLNSVFKQCCDKIEHPDLITDWTHNMDAAVYLKH